MQAHGETAVAIASQVKMVNLLSAEPVVGRHRDDIDLLEQCVRSKLFAYVEGVSPEATAAGVAVAHSLVESLLRDLRERVRKLQPQQSVQSAAFAQPETGSHCLN